MKYSCLVIRFLIFASLNCTLISKETVTLESSVLRLVDGTFINADTIECMRKFQRYIGALLFGDQSSDGTRTGRYEYNGKKYGVHALAQIEQELAAQQPVGTPATQIPAGTPQPAPSADNIITQHQQLLAALQEAKNDFIKLSEEFKSLAQGAKQTMVKLIEESCVKRGRPDSLFLTLAKAKDDNETTTFDMHVVSFATLESVCIDLLNFLTDLIHSCPKANMQFKLRLEKWAKIKGILPEAMQAITAMYQDTIQIAFLGYIKSVHLDKLTLEEITLHKLQVLFEEFLKQRQAAGGSVR